MKLNIAISSSAGYTRALEIKQGGDNMYITFYSAFGFLNENTNPPAMLGRIE